MAEFLKCDHEGCSHVEMCGPFTQEMVGKPCPVCGSSLLTQEDFDGWQRHVAPLIAAFDGFRPVMLEADGADYVASIIQLHEGLVTFAQAPLPDGEDN